MRSNQKLNTMITLLVLVVVAICGLHLKATSIHAESDDLAEVKLVLIYEKMSSDEISSIYAAEDLKGSKYAVRSPEFSGPVSSSEVKFGKIVFKQGAWILVDLLN